MRLHTPLAAVASTPQLEASLWPPRLARPMMRRMTDQPGAAPPAIGLRHLALNVADVARAEAFYVGLLGFRVEWRPDPDNLYLRLGDDNLALHRFVARDADDARAFEGARGQRLAHLGILVARPDDVDVWAAHLHGHNVPFLAEPRTHRDGARSFYCQDPDGNAVQILYHPPISDGAAGAVAGKPPSP
jgi:catechol 2,3-dioxygenase-like lactoylglutathione lyase family enzyme